MVWIGYKIPILGWEAHISDGQIGVLRGPTVFRIDNVNEYTHPGLAEELIFHTNKGVYRMYHDQGCCESVYLEDVAGDMDDLIGTPILSAYESSSSNKYGEERDGPGPLGEYDESYTWSFYNISTIRGSVTLRWYGSSNGYYSEAVEFTEVDPQSLVPIRGY